jgi:hypothetical protein
MGSDEFMKLRSMTECARLDFRYVTAHLKYIEKHPSQKLLDCLFKYAKSVGMDLSPWSKRIESLKQKVVVFEVMKS